MLNYLPLDSQPPIQPTRRKYCICKEFWEASRTSRVTHASLKAGPTSGVHSISLVQKCFCCLCVVEFGISRRQNCRAEL